MKRKLEEKDRQIETLQKRLKKGSGKYSDDNKGGGKEGKGKGKKKGDGRNMPFPIRGQHSVHLGQNLCYDFNLAHGCTAAEPGKACPKGLHICSYCLGSHGSVSTHGGPSGLGYTMSHVTQQHECSTRPSLGHARLYPNPLDPDARAGPMRANI